MRADKMMLSLAALFLCALLAPSPAPASDNDERPAYMIYIDPETGKYTTQDPSRLPEDEEAPTAATPAEQGSSDAPGRSKVPQVAAGALLLVALIVWGVKSKRVKFSMGRHQSR